MDRDSVVKLECKKLCVAGFLNTYIRNQLYHYMYENSYSVQL